MALGRNPPKASQGPCQNSRGCEGQRGRGMLRSRSSELRRGSREDRDTLGGSLRRRVQASGERLDPSQAHAVPRGLGAGSGAGGRAGRARRRGLGGGRPRGPGFCRVGIGPQRPRERHRGVPRRAPSARCGRGAHSPEALPRAVSQQQLQQQRQQRGEGEALRCARALRKPGIYACATRSLTLGTTGKMVARPGEPSSAILTVVFLAASKAVAQTCPEL